MMSKTSNQVKKESTKVRQKRHKKSKDRYSDLNNGKRLAEKFANELAFEIDSRQWMWWNGRILEYNPSVVWDYAKVVAFDIWQEVGRMSEDERNSHLRSALYVQSTKGIMGMIKMAESELAIRTSELDSNPRLLNTQNGILDLSNYRKIKLISHSVDHRMTKLANVAYEPNAKCPTFMKFISRITDNNIELQRALQMVLGSAIEGEIYEEALFIFRGGGANGKTTLINAYHDLLGSYAKQLTPNFTMVKKIQDHPTEVADLFKVRFAVSLEPDEGCQLSESFIKWITGRDMLKGRRMRIC
jgi:putative DNA primase/helicase